MLDGLPLEQFPSYPDRQASLETKNSIITRYVQEIDHLIKGEDGILEKVSDELGRKAPYLRPVRGVSDLRERLLEVDRGVAEATIHAAGHTFGEVIYPGSGTDILSALYLSDNITTIDENSIFDRIIHPQDEIAHHLTHLLKNKLTHNFYYVGVSNIGLLGYAMELSLAGVNLDSLRVVDESIIGGKSATTVQFEIPKPDGTLRTITHTHITATIPDVLSRDDPFGKYLIEKLKGGENQVFLDRAGLGKLILPFIPYFNSGITILTDMEQGKLQRAFKDNMSSVSVQDKTTTALMELSELQNGEPDELARKEDRIVANLGYGYALDLRELQVYTTT